MSLSSETCNRPTFTDLNPVDLNYYPFMNNLDKYNGTCNAVDDLSIKIYVPSKTEDVNAKVLNMVTRIYQTKTLVKYILCDCKCKFISLKCNSNQK